MHCKLSVILVLAGPDPEMLVPGGGALKAEVLNRAAFGFRREGGV